MLSTNERYLVGTFVSLPVNFLRTGSWNDNTLAVGYFAIRWNVFKEENYKTIQNEWAVNMLFQQSPWEVWLQNPGSFNVLLELQLGLSIKWNWSYLS